MTEKEQKKIKQLMKLSQGFEASAVDKVNIEKVESWLMGLSAEDSGYKHYYTMRKRLILEGMVSGMSQEDYWINHGRILELRYANALSIKLLRDKKYAIQVKKANESGLRRLPRKRNEKQSKDLGGRNARYQKSSIEEDKSKSEEKS